MSDLKIDTAELKRAETRLTRVIAEFEATRPVQAQLPDAAAHPVLRSAVHDFRAAWEIRRGELAEELRFVRDAAQAVGDTFRALDEDLALRAAMTETDSEVP